MEKISIIIPCYNGERVLRRCFDSILRQTYTDFEVVFVNDASTDSTMKIAYAYAAQDDRFVIVEQPQNKGVSAARNRGLRHATGAYIQFMDADDELLPDALATLHGALCKEKADLAVCNFEGNPIFLSYLDDRVLDMTVRSDVLEYYQGTFGLVLPWNKLFRREALNVFFDETLHFAEDELFNLAVLQDVHRIVTIRRPLYIYHFAPAENVIVADAASKSCMNKIIENADSKAQNSIWYMGRALLPKRREILENGLRNSHVNFERVDDLLYTRVFDFLFWELSAYAYMRVEPSKIISEFTNILQDDAFIRCMCAQERYGIRYLRYAPDIIELTVRRYVDLCLGAYDCIMTRSLPLRFYDVFLLIFFRLFCDTCPRTCKEYNYLYRLIGQPGAAASPEAEFTANWLENEIQTEVVSA